MANNDFTIDPGELRNRIKIQFPNQIKDDFGAEPQVWNDFVSAWARIEPLTGRELYNAQQIYPETDTLFTMRYRAGIDPSMRIFWNQQQFDITGINDVESRHRLLEINAKQRPLGRRA